MKFLKKYAFIFWAILLASIYTLLLNETHFLSIPYSKTADLFFQYRYDHSKPPQLIKKIVIIDVDETSLIKLQQRWPIRRDLYARFLKNISGDDSKPAVITMNIAFFGKSELPETDLALAEALKESGNVVLGTYLDVNNKLIMPEAILADSAKAVGFVSYPRDNDFIIRRVRPFIFEKNKINYCLMLNTLTALKGQNVTLPVNLRNNTLNINYFAKFYDFQIIPFWKILESDKPPRALKDKIVIVGTSMELLHDIHPTPLGLMPGLAINSNVLMSLLLNRFPVELPVMASFILFILVASSIAFVSYRYNSIKGLILYLLIVLAGYYLSVFYISKDIIFDFFGLNFIALSSFAATAAVKSLSLIIENSRLNKLAVTDPLTGLYVSRYFELKLNSETRIATEAKVDLSLVIFSIDKFQDINTTYGYELGNKVLIDAAACIKRNSRPSDVVSRVEGTKFPVILTRTNLNGAKLYAEKVRKTIEGLQFEWQDKQVKVTVSAGISSLTSPTIKTTEDVLSSAIQALNEAIQQGPNTIKSIPA